MRRLNLLVIASLLAASTATAEGAVPCLDEQRLDVASTQYRDAVYQSDPLHQDITAVETALAAFRVSWRTLVTDSGDCAHLDSATDKGVAQRIEDIDDVAEKAQKQADRGRIDQAHLTLSQIRPLLAELRRGETLEIYGDRLDAFDDKLAEATDDDLDEDEISPDQFVLLCEQIGVLAYLQETLEKRAPSRWSADPDFLDALENQSRQIRGLRAAVLQGRALPIRAAMSDLRQSFDRFWRIYG